MSRIDRPSTALTRPQPDLYAEGEQPDVDALADQVWALDAVDRAYFIARLALTDEPRVLLRDSAADRERLILELGMHNMVDVGHLECDCGDWSSLRDKHPFDDHHADAILDALRGSDGGGA